MELSPVPTFNLRGVLSVSNKLICAQNAHFRTLSLFFLPLSFSLIITPTVLSYLLSPAFIFSGDLKLLTAYLLFNLFAYILALSAIGTITYSTHHAFFSHPVNFSDALKSLTSSFFPLASTAIIANVVVFLISISFRLFVVTFEIMVGNLGIVIDYSSVYFALFSIITGVIPIAISVYLYVEWSLAFAVAVVESKWGFAALKRSSYLVKGMRSVSLMVMLCFGGFCVLVVWQCTGYFRVYMYITWPLVSLVIYTMFNSLLLMMFLLRITAANTVLYNYCKALHGELAVEGFDHEYMNLPSEEG